MKQLAWLLVGMWCWASAATAGPNAGGVLWVHASGLAYSTDLPMPPESPAPADCAGVDHQEDLNDIQRIWKVYAAFPSQNSPRLMGLGWGLSISMVGGGYVAIDPTGCGLPQADGPGTDYETILNGWPDTDGATIEQRFTTGPRTSSVIELYYFSGFGYGGPGNAPQLFAAVPHLDASRRFCVDDAIPEHADPIMGYGSLGFGQAGSTPCPTDDPDAVCCAPLGTCTVSTQGNCMAPSVWHPEWLTCEGNPCPPPTGACCFADGHCTATLEGQCPKEGGTYQGDLTLCLPDPCNAYGACCGLTGACAVTTRGSCVAPSAWHADWLMCDPNPCPQPTAGSILAWGDDASGQCNVPEPNFGYTAVAAGSWHSLGLTTDGMIAAWGDNASGQCSVPAPNSGFTAIAAGGQHSLALRAEGAIVAWGDNTFGQCTVPAPNGAFVAIAAGDGHSLGLKADGSVVAWGRDDFGQCDVPVPDTGFAAIAAGWGHSLGLRRDGSIVAWGDHSSGQCSVPSPNTGFVAIAAGYLHSLGLKTNGAVVAWGYNDFGQCNVPEPNAGFTAIAGGTIHSLALRTGGGAAAWGSDDLGQCRVLSPESAFAQLSAGGYHSLALLSAPGGACCHQDGLCTLTNLPACQPPSLWIGEGVSCQPNPCPATPVLLESATATSRSEGLLIRWEVPLGTTGTRFRTWRDPAAGPLDPAPTPDAALVASAWMSASPEGIIETVDPEAIRGTTVRYFLEMSTNGDRGVFLGPVEARWDPPALVWSVGPIPFSGSVRLAPPVAGPARAEIFDPAGRLVRTLERTSGNEALAWDGRDGAGHKTPTGVYLVRLSAASSGDVKRLVKIQ